MTDLCAGLVEEDGGVGREGAGSSIPEVDPHAQVGGIWRRCQVEEGHGDVENGRWVHQHIGTCSRQAMRQTVNVIRDLAQGDWACREDMKRVLGGCGQAWRQIEELSSFV